MHDTTPESLRKQTLKQNGKTLSRKAQAKMTSLSSAFPGSGPASRNPSATPSAAASEAGDVPTRSRPTSRLGSIGSRTPSPHSDIDFPVDDKSSESEALWIESFHEKVQDLTSGDYFKHSTPQTRERALVGYGRAISSRFVPEQVDMYQDEVVRVLKKVINTDDSDRETVLALKALQLTMVYSPSYELYQQLASLFKGTIKDSVSVTVKTEAIRALGIIAFFGNVPRDTLHATLKFLAEDIVLSDGEEIDALDQPEPVVAAIEAWGLLATTCDELPVKAIEPFLAQLDSSSAPVLLAAGQATALIYEKRHEAAEAARDGDDSSNDDEDTSLDIPDLRAKPAPAEIDPDEDDDGWNERHVVLRLRALAKESSKRFSAAERRELHAAFPALLASVQRPGANGPQRHGADQTVRVTPTQSVTVDRWADLVRLTAVKRCLRDGFMLHWSDNPAVQEALPLDVEQVESSKEKAWKKGKAEKRNHHELKANGFI